MYCQWSTIGFHKNRDGKATSVVQRVSSVFRESLVHTHSLILLCFPPSVISSVLFPFYLLSTHDSTPRDQLKFHRQFQYCNINTLSKANIQTMRSRSLRGLLFLPLIFCPLLLPFITISLTHRPIMLLILLINELILLINGFCAADVYSRSTYLTPVVGLRAAVVNDLTRLIH